MILYIVKRDIQAGDEDGIKMKEQAILNLGKMLSKHGKAEGIIFCPDYRYKEQHRHDLMCRVWCPCMISPTVNFFFLY